MCTLFYIKYIIQVENTVNLTMKHKIAIFIADVASLWTKQNENQYNNTYSISTSTSLNCQEKKKDKQRIVTKWWRIQITERLSPQCVIYFNWMPTMHQIDINCHNIMRASVSLKSHHFKFRENATSFEFLIAIIYQKISHNLSETGRRHQVNTLDKCAVVASHRKRYIVVIMTIFSSASFQDVCKRFRWA